MTGKNPAKFPPGVIQIASAWLRDYERVLDPFAGSGRVHLLQGNHFTVGVEIEPDWEIDIVGPRILGNSLYPPFRMWSFDAIFTSPAYGNRMSDHHNARDASKRNTYTHRIGHQLHASNAGKMPFGKEYWDLHEGVWRAAVPLLRPGGKFVLNTKNFYNKIKGQDTLFHVTDWHTNVLLGLGLVLVGGESYTTSGLGHGANRDVRVPAEDVLLFHKP